MCALLVLLAVAAPQMPDAEGFVPLSGGPDLSGWHAMGAQCWSWRDGMIECAGQGSGWLRSEAVYGDFTLRYEYRIVNDGNSGVWLRAPLRGRQSAVGMEVQILGRHFDPPTTDASGALYDLLAPSVDASRGPEEWNEAEVTCIGRRISTVLNGVRLYDADLDDAAWNSALPAGRKPRERNMRGFIGLTNHGACVLYRNVRIKPEPEQGFEALLDGGDLSGWQAVEPWRVEDGAAVCDATRETMITTTRRLTDYDLRLRYRLAKGARGSVLLRAADDPKAPRVEISLADDAGAQPSVEGSGALRKAGVPHLNAALPAGEWNDLDVTYRGHYFRVRLNATPVLEGSIYWFGSFNGAPIEGRLGLVAVSGKVELADVRARELQPEG